jgi:hypothetical protein
VHDLQQNKANVFITHAVTVPHAVQIQVILESMQTFLLDDLFQFKESNLTK